MIIKNSVIDDNCYCVNDDEFELFDEYNNIIKEFVSKISNKYHVFGEFSLTPENMENNDNNHNIIIDLSVCKNPVHCGVEFVSSNSIILELHNPIIISLTKEPKLVLELYTPNNCYIEGHTGDLWLVKEFLNLISSIIEKYNENNNNPELLNDVKKLSFCTELIKQIIELKPSSTEFMIDAYYNYTVDLRVLCSKKFTQRTFRIRNDNTHVVRNFKRMLKGCL